jgi:DNA-3-methyladenine glycosylase I
MPEVEPGPACRRCAWVGRDKLMQDYHDREWGVPERDPRRMWEMLMLEGFQAGLAWITILRKREAFRRAFAEFDPARVARFTEADVLRLLGDAGIVRSRAKIEATIAGARIFLAMQERGDDLAALAWSHVDNAPRVGDGHSVPTQTEISVALAKALKRLGFKFVGPSIVYAWMQATGMANDHAQDCFRRAELLA